MIKIKLLLFAVFLSLASVAIAQNVKPKFKKLIFIGYYEPPNNQEVHILDYTIQFSENDSVHYTANNFGKNNIYGMSDTTYAIPDTLVTELNKIFNGKKPLRSHMITDKLPNGDSTYSGHIYFINYTTGNNASDSFIAVQPFLDKQLSMLIDKITAVPRSRTLIKRKIYHNADLEIMVREFQKTCQYVPKTAPPTVKFLKPVDPPANH